MSLLRLPVPCLAALALVTGCHRAEIRVYRAPKDEAVVAAPDAERPALAKAAMESARPRLGYQTPPGWTPGEGGQVSAVSFDIAQAEGKASVNITPLADFSGREELVINMWRQQVGAAPLSSEEAEKALSDVEIGGAKGRLFEVSGVSDGKPHRIVTAMLNRPDGTWFFKLGGDEAVVAAQKPTFLEFLQTIRFSSGADETAAAPAKAE